MLSITFKAKIQTVYNMDETVAYQYVRVPEMKRAHCDMHAFRMSAKFGGYANSDLFPSMLKRAIGAAGVKKIIRSLYA